MNRLLETIEEFPPAPEGTYYILEGKTPQPITDFIKWGKWMQEADRHVAQDVIDGVKVSTVFLGLNHSFNPGKPILFETMIFGGILDLDQQRYRTWEEAHEGHKKMVLKVKNSPHG